MIDILVEMFSYPFIQRAILVGLLVSLCASLLGVSLVLKKYSMIGDGLSHVGFGALSIAFSLNTLPFFADYYHIDPLIFCIITVLIVAFLLLRISDKRKMANDAAIALVSATAFTVGVIFISLTTGINTDVCNTLFGTILAMSKNDVYISVVLSVIVLSMFIFFFHQIFAVTFDEDFARATGIKVDRYNALIALLTAITIVLGMRIMGSLLISSLIIFPALTSMRLFKTFRKVIISSALVSLVCFLSGIIVSYVYRTPAGASIVAVNIVLFIVFSLIDLIQRRLPA